MCIVKPNTALVRWETHKCVATSTFAPFPTRNFRVGMASLILVSSVIVVPSKRDIQILSYKNDLARNITEILHRRFCHLCEFIYKWQLSDPSKENPLC
eukprot:jgi/Botrbrau1/3960/Bobra.0365s0033.1